MGEVVKPTKTIRILEVWQFRPQVWPPTSTGWIRGCGTIMCYPPSVSSICKPDYVWGPGWHNGLTAVGWFDGHVTFVQLCPPAACQSHPRYGIIFLWKTSSVSLER